MAIVLVCIRIRSLLLDAQPPTPDRKHDYLLCFQPFCTAEKPNERTNERLSMRRNIGMKYMFILGCLAANNLQLNELMM